MRGEVRALLRARVVRLHPTRRVAVVQLKPVGRGRCFAGAYSGASGELAPVVDGNPYSRGRHLGRLVKVNPTAGGAELDLVVRDAGAWEALATGTARVEAVVAFTSSIGGEPAGGRPVRIEVF